MAKDLSDKIRNQTISHKISTEKILVISILSVIMIWGLTSMPLSFAASFDYTSVPTGGTVLQYRDIASTVPPNQINLDPVVTITSSQPILVGNPVNVQIQDANANIDVNNIETITAVAGNTPFTLTETGANTGIFEGSYTSAADISSISYDPGHNSYVGRATIDLDLATGGTVGVQDVLGGIGCQGFFPVTDPITVTLADGATLNAINSVTLSYANGNLDGNDPENLRMYYAPPGFGYDFVTEVYFEPDHTTGLDKTAQTVTTNAAELAFAQGDGSTATSLGEGSYLLGVDVGCGGSGGGGISSPGLVFDALAGFHVGGKAIAPPSFGGRTTHYTDGLTLDQGNNKPTTYDLSKYNQDTPVQILVAGEKVDMTFKTFQGYNPNAVVHMGLYFIPKTSTDMITSNSIASIIYDKGVPVQINDPNHIMSDGTVSPTSDNKYQYTKFSFLPTKSFANMAFLARAWNDHKYSTDVRMYDAAPPTIIPEVYPDGVIKFTDWNVLYEKVRADGYDKSKEMSHIQSTDSVFVGVDNKGEVYWLYDTNARQVTLVIKDSDGVIRYSSTQPLEKLIKLTYDACDTEQFKPYCLNNSVYGHQSRELTIPEIEHLFYMGAWQGKLPTGLSYEQIRKDLANQ